MFCFLVFVCGSFSVACLCVLRVSLAVSEYVCSCLLCLRIVLSFKGVRVVYLCCFVWLSLCIAPSLYFGSIHVYLALSCCLMMFGVYLSLCRVRVRFRSCALS